MISKLKSECGFQYTSKLEGMFNDLKVVSVQRAGDVQAVELLHPRLTAVADERHPDSSI